MAVYTKVDLVEAQNFIDKNYDLEDILSIVEISEGVENTNYILETRSNKYILTLYEDRVSVSDLPFFIDLMVYLDERSIVCPKPIRMKNGKYIEVLNGRYAAIFSFLSGKSTKKITNRNCFLVGQTLANLHEQTSEIKIMRQNQLSQKHLSKLFDSIENETFTIRKSLQSEIKGELNYLNSNWPAELPNGIIHGDLFPDNIFFNGDELSGVIDFYFACNDFYVFDIGISINAWCFEKDNSFNITKAKHLLQGYNSIKALTYQEIDSLPIMCRGSALRFLLTRLIDWNKPGDNALVTPKDPIEYYAKLKFHQTVISAKDYGLYD
jgi:homoserine kinase type II